VVLVIDDMDADDGGGDWGEIGGGYPRLQEHKVHGMGKING
jgi:hypothetical protein